MTSINKVIVKELEHAQDEQHEHGPAVISLPSTRYLERILGTLAKYGWTPGTIICILALGIAALALWNK